MSPIEKKHRRTVVIMGFALIVCLLLSFTLGRYPVPLGELLGILGSKLGLPVDPFWTSQMEAAVWNIRLPRVVLSVLVGACLAAAGGAYQGVFQNPMASPDILGASAGSYRIRSDVWELQQLMTEAFGWHCRLVLGLESTTEQLRTAGQSALNLVIRTEARDIAETLKKQSGTPYVYGAPYGYEGTLKWLESISQVIGQPINPELRARLEEKIADNAPATMGGPMGMMHRREPVAVLSGDYDVIVGLAGAMREMEVDVACMDCHHSLKAVPNSNGEVTVFPREKDRLDYFGSVHHAWVLGDNIIPNFCGEDNFYTPVSFPFDDAFPPLYSFTVCRLFASQTNTQPSFPPLMR